MAQEGKYEVYGKAEGLPLCPPIPEEEIAIIVPKEEPNKIFDICIAVTQITEAEVQEIREIAQGQLNYCSPLRMATTAQQNELGRHNNAVLDALLKLKEVIESGAHLGE